MPVNDYKCTHCGTTFEDIRANTEHDAMVKIMWEKCPQQSEPGHANKAACPLVRVMSTAGFADPYRIGHKQPDSWFKDRVKQIKKDNPGNRLP
jgi:predicted nucleic acid-binding Zn ribbon protein